MYPVPHLSVTVVAQRSALVLYEAQVGQLLKKTALCYLGLSLLYITRHQGAGIHLVAHLAAEALWVPGGLHGLSEEMHGDWGCITINTA